MSRNATLESRVQPSSPPPSQSKEVGAGTCRGVGKGGAGFNWELGGGLPPLRLAWGGVRGDASWMQESAEGRVIENKGLG